MPTTGEAAKSLVRVATKAPSHGPTRLQGLCHVGLLRRGHIGASCGGQGAMTVSPLGLHGYLDKASSGRSWSLGGLGCEWIRPQDSKSEV